MSMYIIILNFFLAYFYVFVFLKTLLSRVGLDIEGSGMDLVSSGLEYALENLTDFLSLLETNSNATAGLILNSNSSSTNSTSMKK